MSTHNLSPQKLVAGVPTNPTAGSDPYYDITSPLYLKFRGLAFQYKDFGGVMGWHFDVAQVAGVLDPVGWTHYAYWAQHGKDLSAIVSLLLND